MFIIILYLIYYVYKCIYMYIYLCIYILYIYSVANSDRSSVIADHLGVLGGQNRRRFLEMTEHNLYVNVYLDNIFVSFTS